MKSTLDCEDHASLGPALPNVIEHSPNTAFGDLLLALVIPLWLAALSYPALVFDLIASPTLATPYQIASFSAAILTISLINSHNMGKAISLWYNSSLTLPLLIAMILAIFNAILVGKMDIILYVMALVATITAFMSIWIIGTNIIRRTSYYSGLMLTGFIAYAFLTQPLDLEYRHVGLIHPNLLGAIAMSGSVLYFLSHSRFRFVALILAGAVMVAVSSRSSLVAFAAFIIVIGIYYSRLGKNARLWTLAAAIAATILLFKFQDRVTLFLQKALALDDIGRGLSSGLSGRFLAWENFQPQLYENLFLGFGFRQRDDYVGTHNSILNLFLENGVLGATMLLGFLLLLLAIALRRAFAMKFINSTDQYFAAVVSASIVAFLVRALAEPQLFNIGDAPSVVFLFLLAYVAFGDTKEKQTVRSLTNLSKDKASD